MMLLSADRMEHVLPLDDPVDSLPDSTSVINVGERLGWAFLVARKERESKQTARYWMQPDCNMETSFASDSESLLVPASA
mmetsp:Transcript_16807/g.35567  ORF Transcript_16807/g.35567 Transcript_16807/m.35567 type:complete len:80 (+) Transcript_16807:979-1218(+)